MGMFDFMGTAGPPTWDEVERRRALAEALAEQATAATPQTFGAGLSALGAALGGVMAGRRADRADAARAPLADQAFEAALSTVPQDNRALAAALAPAGMTPFAPARPSGDPLRDGIIETAQAIGADPVDLATAISYETAGTFDPTKAGPTTQWGRHRGLIQFGEPQAKQYGVDWSDPIGSQLGANGAVANYFRDRGFKPGMSGLDLYSTINAGAPGRYSASDAGNGGAPGDVQDKWLNQMQPHRRKAMQLLGGDPVAAAPTAPGPATLPQVPQPAGANVALLRAMQNPYMTPEQKQLLAGVYQQQIAAQPTAMDVWKMQQDQQRLAMEQQKFAVEMQEAARPKPVEINGQLVDPSTGAVLGDYRTPDAPAAPASVQEYEYYAKQAQARGEQPMPYEVFSVEKARAGANSVSVSTGGGKFDEEFAKGDAAALGAVAEAGMAAQRNLARIDQLEGLLGQGPTGFAAAAAQRAGEWGINTEGLDTIQAAQALINSLVPEQRQPGSGPMSDADLALFKQSLPRIINQPGGNQLIVNTMRGVAQYDAAGAQIVQQLRQGQIDRAQAFEMLQARPNPLAQFKAPPQASSSGSLPTTALVPVAPPVAVPQAPAPDTPPEGITPEEWQHMSPEERALWQ